jgi:branched-chain amino acid transport system permease protein
MSVNGRLAAVYTLGGALASAAGALLAQTTGFASLDVLEFHRSADVMLALIIGGAGWLWGGLVGAIAFKVLHDLISAVTTQYWTFWIGLFLVVLMLVGASGCSGPGPGEGRHERRRAAHPNTWSSASAASVPPTTCRWTWRGARHA